MNTFFLLGGFFLLLTGTVQVAFRPRGPRESAATRWLNAATVRAVLFATAGVVAILLGLGVLPLPGPPTP